MDVEMVESIEKDDPSEGTLPQTIRWKEITKPGDYRFTQCQWRKYSPPRTLRGEQKRNEVEMWQKRNKIFWQRMENNSREEADRKRVFHRVIEKLCPKETKLELAATTTNSHQNETKSMKCTRGKK